MSDEVANEIEIEIQYIKRASTRPSRLRCLLLFFRRAHRMIMKYYIRETVVLCLLMLSALISMQKNTTKKLQSAKAPEPFFTPHSFVHDWYNGELRPVFDRVTESDLSIILFYAPWDGDSLAVRTEFEKVARIFYKQIYFAAVNCWWPKGDCRKHYQRAAFYPNLVAYVSTGKGVAYSGPYEAPFAAPHIANFVLSVMKPLSVVHTREMVESLKAVHNTVVLGYFDFVGVRSPIGFRNFVSQASKNQETDPLHDAVYGIVSNKEAALSLGFNLSQPVRMYSWNDEQILNWNATTNLIRETASAKLEMEGPVSQWIVPPRFKSDLMALTLEHQPTIIMFTPKNPLDTITPYYHMFREVALAYRNCDNCSSVRNLIKVSASLRRQFVRDLEATNQRCVLLRQESLALQRKLAKSVLMGVSSLCGQDGNFTNQRLQDFDDGWDSSYVHDHNVPWGFSREIPDQSESVVESSGTKCGASPPVVTGAPKKCLFMRDRGQPKQNGAIVDDKIDKLLRENERLKCKLRQLSGAYDRVMGCPSGRASIPAELSERIDGLACRTNRSLGFVAIDSIQFDAFAAKLGVDLEKAKHRTSVILVDAPDSSHFVMDAEVTKSNIVEFILNYTAGSLQRFKRSAAVHSHGVDPNTTERIVELNSKTFIPVVMDNQKDVVVLFYARSCGFCLSMSSIYLELATQFKNFSKTVIFSRLNGDNNDLPWQYTVDRYPTITIFPAHRKSESRTFPIDSEVTLPNLIKFVYSYSRRRVITSSSLEFCNADCIARNRKQALERTYELLSDYRRTSAELRSNSTLLPGEALFENYKLCRILWQLNRLKSLHLSLSTLTRGSLGKSEFVELIASNNDSQAECKY